MKNEQKIEISWPRAIGFSLIAPVLALVIYIAMCFGLGIILAVIDSATLTELAYNNISLLLYPASFIILLLIFIFGRVWRIKRD